MFLWYFTPPYLCSIVGHWQSSAWVKHIQMKNCRNHIFGKVVYISIIHNISQILDFIEWLWFLVLIAWIRSNDVSIKFVQKMRKKWHSTRSTLNHEALSSRESLGNYRLYPSLYSCNSSPGVYKNASYRGHCATLCNDNEKDPGSPINMILHY